MQSAHDCSDGGLAVTVAECCLSPQVAQGKPLGATIRLDSNGLRTDELLFGESPSRIILSVSPAQAEHVLAIAREHEVPARDIGTVGDDRLIVHVHERPTDRFAGYRIIRTMEPKFGIKIVRLSGGNGSGHPEQRGY